MSMLSQATARRLVHALSQPSAPARSRLWGGEGRATRTGRTAPSIVAYWSGSELRCHDAFRHDFDPGQSNPISLDAPSQIARGSVYYSHDSDDGTAVLFASVERP